MERLEGRVLDDDLVGDFQVDTVVRLVPAPPVAGTLTIAFTHFPGLAVRLGRWYVEWYPGCGCDACDERSSRRRLDWTEAHRLGAPTTLRWEPWQRR